jgi:putative tricarboxylic transport membrane protein
MKKFGYQAAPLVLALVLGPMLEEAFRQSLITSRGSFTIFFTRPISVGFLIVAFILLIIPIITMRKKTPVDEES